MDYGEIVDIVGIYRIEIGKVNIDVDQYVKGYNVTHITTGIVEAETVSLPRAFLVAKASNSALEATEKAVLSESGMVEVEDMLNASEGYDSGQSH